VDAVDAVVVAVVRVEVEEERLFSVAVRPSLAYPQMTQMEQPPSE